MNTHTWSSAGSHKEIQLLLPWYLKQSLVAHERKRVEAHLHTCIICQREMVFLRNLDSAVNQTSIQDTAADASFALMQKKLHDTSAAQSSQDSASNKTIIVWPKKPAENFEPIKVKKPLYRGLGVNRMVTRFAVAALLVFSMVPLLSHYGASFTAGYYTLSAAKPELPDGVKLRVVFSQSLSESDIDSLIKQIHGQRIEGPNRAGAYTIKLALDAQSMDIGTALAFLRSQQHIIFAEPVTEP